MHVRSRFLCLAILLLTGLPALGTADETASLSSTIADADPGQANGHDFAHLVELDPEVTYLGGALITEDVCIHGNGARVDLAGEWLLILAAIDNTRCDIDHCLIVNGVGSSYEAFGGGVIYGASTQGWIVNNTFYNNEPSGLYLDRVSFSGSNVKVSNNIFFKNVPWGLIRSDSQQDLPIHNNDSYGHAAGGDYGEHCSCPGGQPEQIFPPYDLDGSNFSSDPLFVEDPNPPKVTGDFHLLPDSPCIGAGESGEDLGAYPLGTPPAVQSHTWSYLKALYR